MKCIVKDCMNHQHEGGFFGDICIPCYEFISKGKSNYSQAYRNAMQTGETEVGINLSGTGASIQTRKKTLTIQIGDNFFHWISNPAKTKPHGQTVGELNRAWILESVDKFIDRQWGVQ